MVKVFRLLQEIDFDKKKYVVNGDKLFYQLQGYETFHHNNVNAESHRVYCDVQFILSGREAIGWAPYDSSEDSLQKL